MKNCDYNGRLFLVVMKPRLCTNYYNPEKNWMTKDEIIDNYEKWYEGKRQKKRKKEDMEKMMNLESNAQYYFVTRQWAGHSDVPTKICLKTNNLGNGYLKPIFKSQVVGWGEKRNL